MGLFRIVIINLMVLFSLLFLILITPPIAFKIYFFFKYGIDNIQASDPRVDYDVYNDFNWAEKHYKEFDMLETCYKDFYVWRRCDFRGQTININNGIRNTKNFSNKAEKFIKFDQVSFFGGSTMWGTGVSDDTTLPSIFASQTNSRSLNYGESGYIAIQELLLLQNLLIEKKLKKNNLIIFYDGINEVLARCRKDYNGLVTAQYDRINNILEKNKVEDNKYSFRKLFLQVEMFLTAILKRINGTPSKNISNNFNQINLTDVYDCDENKQKAEKVAKQLIHIWKMADKIIELQEDKIIKILQPVAYIGNPKIKYLSLTSTYHSEQAKQYLVVYPLIKKIAEEQNVKYYDLTDIYDECDDCYVDQFHVGPKAHKLLSKEIVNIIEKDYQ